ncbi:uncharacterized protein LOC108052740 [Drosophila rhopaloa]|uniref:Uncharacterized protein LOC108052740 n=1 Tax=Drosophila rhopaloa TaxID=1041015 RepID=A0A6P4FJM4_DRORH|nr:uncharacterized protein LOC108052740 [Drosophila rhopaloa]
MTDKEKNRVPEPVFDDSSEDDLSQDDPSRDDSIGTTTVSISPSILRPTNPSRHDLSNAPSIVISLPDAESDTNSEETAEHRLRRRMRFLEMRREHYSNMHSERCHMEHSEDEDHEEHKKPN